MLIKFAISPRVLEATACSFGIKISELLLDVILFFYVPAVAVNAF